MYQLSLHIEYLLLRHDCVVLPGFGAFINVRHAARYDAARRVWMPMTREVRFNSALTHDDGLLANSFARKNRISFQEGREMLRRAGMQLREALAADGEVTIGQLGILRQNEDAVEFVPMVKPERMAAMLGFAAAPIAARAAEMKKETPEANADAAAETAAELSEAGVGENETAAEAGGEKAEKPRRSFDTERNYYIPVNKVFARVAACLLILVVAGLAVVLPASNRRQVDKASVFPVENISLTTTGAKAPGTVASETQAADVQAQAADAQAQAAGSQTQAADVHSEAQAAGVHSETKAAGGHSEATVPGASAPVVGAAPTSASKAEPAKARTSAGKYHLVVATFNNEGEARRFLQAHAGCGFQLEMVTTKTKSRVSARCSNNREELQSLMRTAEFHDLFPDAWIWKK